jgi:kynurenine formamidase
MCLGERFFAEEAHRLGLVQQLAFASKGRFGLQCLTNLDLLPPKGAVIIAAPLKIKQGSGSPLRVLALVADGGK